METSEERGARRSKSALDVLEPADGKGLLPDSIIAGRYRLVRRLGEGAMGVVYEADDSRLGQAVALKLLSPALNQDPTSQERFLDEVRFARKVSHPNVCRVHDVGESDGVLFLTMELIDGEDLRAFLAHGPLPRDQAVRLCLQICRGVAAIHEQGLLYRDLKPGNVMIDGRGQARLTDFGWATPISAEDAADASRASSPSGTLAYLAPELLLGEPATMRSDVYTLGLLIHELVTGRRAYPKHALFELARWSRDPSITVPPVDLHLENTLDPAMARIIRWCLATVPRDRPASVEAVAAALEPDAEGQPGTYLTTLVVSDLDDGEHTAEALLAEHGGRAVASPVGRLWLFERPWGAVSFVLTWRHSSVAAGLARVGIHLGEACLERQDRGSLRVAEGAGLATAKRLAAMARSGQTLLTPHAFDLARHHQVPENQPEAAVRWLSHGRYQLAGCEEASEIFEVGLEGGAPFAAPDSSEQAQAVPADAIAGWRPAPGATIPQHPDWRIVRKLGAGGFGDVWQARAVATGELRALKFCYDAGRLRALQREITVFRLLREELGERSDITRVIDWSFERAPYFIESEYIVGGSLDEWAERQGGLARVPIALRLEIVAQVATALAAAHSVGVLHKDVKPGNVLIAGGEEGKPRARLGDFGISQVTDRRRLAAAGITALGLTEITSASSSANDGTRLYLAPELLEGKPPTLRSDIYALGVMLYQMVIGDLTRALASGWRRDIDDPILRDDIAEAVDGSPDRRLGDAARLASWLRSLERRRVERASAERVRRRTERARRLRPILVGALIILTLFATVVATLAWRIGREAERAEEEARSAQQVAEFMVGLFETTDPFESPRTALHERTARDVLDQGARRLDSELGDQPEIRARLINTVGRIYQRLGLYDAAEGELEKALALRRVTLGEDDPAVAESLHDLAWVLHLRGEAERAEVLLRKTLALRRASLGDEHPYVANTLHDLAWVLQAKGDLDDAERTAREALALKRRLPGETDREVAASLNHLAFLLLSKGDLPAAELSARQALTVTRQLWDEHPDVAESLNGLARVLLVRGDAEGAEPLAREALAMRRRLLGAEHPAVAQSLHDLAVILMARRAYASAEPLLAEALELYERLFGERSPGVIMTLNSMAELYEARGEPEKASEIRGRL